MCKYITRLCWNDNNWEKPSGIAKRLESGTFCSQYGFGFEEWLFSDKYTLNECRYGFLQGVNRSKVRLAGQTINVHLFAIYDNRRRYYIGKINNCHVLTQYDCERVLIVMRNKGLISEMINDVKAISGDKNYIVDKAINADIGWELYNISFNHNDLIIYKNPILIPASSDVWKLNRYLLYKLTQHEENIINSFMAVV